MATSPNYGWLEPDNTDLVKNGALAIRTLGDAIDTTMATMTPKSIVDAKGDLIAASANDTPARLAVGANGETLVADSSTSTGLRYQAPVNANPTLNSAMQIWQRGTSFTSSNVYTADRWYKGAAPAATFSRQVTGDTTNLPFIQYCTRIQRNSGSAATNAIDFGQNFESVNSIPYAGKTVTLSFYARAGANYSATSSAMTAQVYSGTGTDQSVFTGFTGQATVLSSAVTLTTTWQRFTATATVGATATQLALYFQYSPTGTAGANDYYEITGVQLEVGSVATPFKTYAGTIQGELAACQRYYYRQTSSTNAYTIFGVGGSASATQARFAISYPVTMRTTPTAVDFSSLGAAETGASVIAVTAASIDGANGLLVSIGSSSFTQYRNNFLYSNNSTSAFVGFSAEL